MQTICKRARVTTQISAKIDFKEKHCYNRQRTLYSDKLGSRYQKDRTINIQTYAPNKRA